MSRLSPFCSIILVIASSTTGFSMLDCDFELNTTCDWKTSRSFKVDRVDRVLNKNAYMPYHDHTVHSLTGHFGYISESEPTRINGWLEAKNPFHGQNESEICFTFAYYFLAMQPSIMSLNLVDGDRTVKIYQMNSANMIRWEEIRIPIDFDQFNVEKFSFIVTIAQGVLAIDDIRVFSGDCGTEQPDFCHFELAHQSCPLFSPVHNSSLPAEWTVREGRDLSMVDHTIHTKGGHFYGIDVGSLTRRDGNLNDYLIHSQPYHSPVCFRFSYFIGGPQSDVRLFVGLKQNDRMVRVWQVSGHTGEMWLTHQQRIEPIIDQYPCPFEIIMGIETKNVNQEDKVFVDDVSLLETNYCSEDGRCDFEDGDMCLLEPIMVGHQSLSPDRKNLLTQTKNYTDLSAQDYLNGNVDVGWRVFSPYQSKNFLQHDSTTGKMDGKYLLLTGQNRFDRAIFATGRYAVMDLQQKSLCLCFRVYQPSNGTILEIYQSEPLLGNEAMKIWDHRNRSASWYGEDWKRFEVYAQVRNQSSTDMFFYFVGTIDDPSNDYIALDDFLVKAKCDNPSNEKHQWTTITTTTTTTTKNPDDYFQCLNGTYIPVWKRCNWIDDCPHGEDEQDCGSCHFQTADQICDYKISNSDDQYSFGFSSNRPDDMGPPDGPTGPFYMIAYGTFEEENLKPNIYSWLISPIIHQTYTESCAVSFYYHSNNAKDGQLSLMVDLEDIGESVPLWQSKAQPLKDDQWIPILIDLHRIRHPFQLIFSSQPGLSASTFQAIGDINLGGCHPDPPSPNDQCSDGQYKCLNKVCVSKQYVCDLEDDCGDASDEIGCDQSKVTDFEQNFGLWGQEYNLNWRIVQAQYSGKDLRKAPCYDHTTGLSTGHYLFVTGLGDPEPDFRSHVTENVMAEIPSPRFMAHKPNCALRFFLFKNSKNSTLLVEKLVISNNGSKVTIDVLDQITNHSATEFVKFVYNFNQSSDDVYQIRLAAQLDHSPLGFLYPYLAIDDISFSENCTMIQDHPGTTTRSPHVNPKNKHDLKIFFAIIIPILIMVGIWITVKTCLRYRKRRRAFTAISMRTLRRASTITDKI